MLRSDDTIAAIATPAGSGGVGVIRISGPAALGVLESISGRSASAFADRLLTRGHVCDAGRQRLDEVLFVAMRGPRSFTGEDVVEVHGHGGAVNMGRLLRAVLEAGARLAEAGEFTRRALENGKLDLAQAEALLGVIEASSERSLRLAQAQLGGQLGAEVERLQGVGTSALAVVEAGIDFPEDGLEDTDRSQAARALSPAIARLDALVGSFELGAALRSGIVAALTGPVNAGKSSLLNALVGRERALVSDEPGTTRDYVEAQVVWDGVQVTLIDTAGESLGAGGLESRGIELGRARAGQADVKIRLIPPSSEADDSAPGPGPRELWVASKSDCEDAAERPLAVSAKTGEGLDALRSAILEVALGPARDADDGLVVTSERQRDRLVDGRDAYRRAHELMLAGGEMELIAIELRTGNQALAEVRGVEVGDEVLDDLFARFCIGK